MSLYAVNNDQTNICENVIVLDSGSQWAPPAGYYIVNVDGVDMAIGWYYDQAANTWTAPPTITASFSPNPVFVGQATTLSWTTTNATSVKISSQGDQVFPASGSLDFSYTTVGLQKEFLTATGLAGDVQFTAAVRTVATNELIDNSPAGASNEPTVL
jgi:hypothetical protein